MTLEANLTLNGRMLSAAQYISLGFLLKHLRKNLRAQIIFQNISLPKDIYFGLYDTQNAEGQTYLIHKFNHQLAVEFKARQSAFIWDFNRLIQNKGV